MADVKDGYDYTKDHEWLKTEGTECSIGISPFAVEQLGDITLVSIDVKVGDTLTAGKTFGTVESVKTLSDLFSPVAGKVVRINTELDQKPELVNADCYAAWMIVVEPTGKPEGTLDAAAYRDLLKTL